MVNLKRKKFKNFFGEFENGEFKKKKQTDHNHFCSNKIWPRNSDLIALNLLQKIFQ